MTDATMIYTAKPDAVERSIFADLGIDPEVIREERELECIIQFAARLSVRDPASAEPLEINVYDIEQAEWLARYFSTSNYLTIEVLPIDLGFMDYKRPRSRPGPAPKAYTPEEAEARKIAHRDAKRIQKRQQRARKAAGLPDSSGVDDLMAYKGMRAVNEDWDKFTLDEYRALAA